MVSFDDFKKLELKAGKILAAEAFVGSEKLVKLSVDLGEGAPRQILAGILKSHPPRTLVGRSIIVVANLEPRRMMGEESRGMLLAAEDETTGGPVLLMPEREVPPGATVR